MVLSHTVVDSWSSEGQNTPENWSPGLDLKGMAGVRVDNPVI